MFWCFAMCIEYLPYLMHPSVISMLFLTSLWACEPRCSYNLTVERWLKSLDMFSHFPWYFTLLSFKWYCVHSHESPLSVSPLLPSYFLKPSSGFTAKGVNTQVSLLSITHPSGRHQHHLHQTQLH